MIFMKRVLVSTLGMVAAYCGFIALDGGTFKVRADSACQCVADEVGDLLCDMKGGGGYQCYNTECSQDPDYPAANGVCDLIGDE